MYSSTHPPRPAPRSQSSLGIRPLEAAQTRPGNDSSVESTTSEPAPLKRPVSSPTLFSGIVPLFQDHDPDLYRQYVAEPEELSDCKESSNSSSRAEKPQALQERRSISPVYFKYVQRTLCTVILAGTFMAGVEAQLLSLIFSTPDTTLRSSAIGFAVFALLSTAFVALYSAVTYMWLRQDWRHKPLFFEEWVTGSLTMMTRWCGVFLVIGIYSGFVAVLLFLFAAAPRTVAVFSVAMFILCGIGPMTWGLYHYCGLRFGWLEWSPGYPLLKFRPRRRATSPV